MTRSGFHEDPLWLQTPFVFTLFGIPLASRNSLDPEAAGRSNAAASPGSYLMILELKAACNSRPCESVRYHGSFRAALLSIRSLDRTADR
jgi:hypothetical protein